MAEEARRRGLDVWKNWTDVGYQFTPDSSKQKLEEITAAFLAGEFDADRDSIKYLVYAMVYRGHAQSHPYEHATQKGDRKVFSITDKGREYLWMREQPLTALGLAVASGFVLSWALRQR